MPEQSLHISSLAKLDPKTLEKVLGSLTNAESEQLFHDWRFQARPDQVAPPGTWTSWLMLGGRGAGKTRAGVEFIREKVKAGAKRLGMIAPTAKAARDVLIEGESGVLSVSWSGDKDDAGNPMGRPLYEPSKLRLTWDNGAVCSLYSAEEPERLRGPQHDVLLCDELAAWPGDPQDAWDMAMFGLRLGEHPQVMVTTTPKPIPIIRELMRAPHGVMTKATTYANRAHLAPTFLSQIIAKYEGTRLGRQELDAEVIDEVEGALWSRATIDKARIGSAPDLVRVVVGIDPAASHNSTSNLTGIVAAGVGVDGLGYVLEDGSGRYSPDGWGRRSVALYEAHKGDRLVAEGNQGGEMVRHVIQSVMPNAPVSIVHARRGKQARAEPVAALYEQGKVRHVGAFAELEDQMATWEPLSGMASPDRLDALVWALTDLMLTGGAQSTDIGAPVSVAAPLGSRV